jgi:prolyl-tRNA synthetase
MLMSRLFGRTLREAPGDAEHESHQLLLRARLVEQLAAGIYSYLPLGYRVLRKIEQIVREEMDAAGGQEILMPAMQPVDLWEESGRKESMGDTMFTLTDRRERHLALGPTHEEVVVDLFRRNVQSYREMPQLLYQIQTKFRDEQRPRLGLVRGREFGMMDLYSFDADVEGLDRSYQAMFDAYTRVFQRCGVPAVPVLADSGAIGGKDSQEFVLLTDIGEDEFLLCPKCGYAANSEKADHKKFELPPEEPERLEEVATPGQKTIEDLVHFLEVPHWKTLKAVFYAADRKPVFVAIRGDLAVNEIKLKNALKAADLRLMGDDEVREYGLVAGSASPVGLKGMRILADDSVLTSPNLVAGGNKPDVHLRNVNFDRDWQADIVTDISLARKGDPCPNCGELLDQKRGIEMGHIFKLLTVYSERMGARFLDADGQTQLAIMGCYGIGTSRLLHCVVEANRDERGIVWPPSLAPYDVHIVGLGLDRQEVADKAQSLYATLTRAGIEVLYDDRTESPGVKFNDADLLGMPVRVTVSPRSLEKDAVEVKRRASTQVDLVPFSEAASSIAGLVREQAQK